MCVDHHPERPRPPVAPERVATQPVTRQLVTLQWASVLSALRTLLCALMALAAVLQPVKASAQLVAELDLETSSGYGRMVLTFPGQEILPDFDLRTNNGVLVLDWREPVAIDLGRTAQNLEGYVTIVRQDSDNGALRFALARGVRVNSMEAGERLFLDFLPANWTGPPPALPESVVQELAERARQAFERAQRAERRLEGLDQLRLKLNVGLNPTFTRFSFEWNAPFGSSFVRKDDEVLITFDQAANLDVSAIKANLPPGVGDIITDVRDEQLRVLMVVDPRSDVRAFSVDTRYVVDVTNPDGPRDPEEEVAIRSSIDAPLPAEGDVANVVTTRGDTAASVPAQPYVAPVVAQPGAAPSPIGARNEPLQATQEVVQSNQAVAPTSAAAEDLPQIAPPEQVAVGPSQVPVEPQQGDEGQVATSPAMPAPRAAPRGSSPGGSSPRGSSVRIGNIPPSVPPSAGGQVVVSQSAMPTTTAAPEATSDGEVANASPVPLTGPRGFAEAVPTNVDRDSDTIRVNANRIGNVVRMVFPFKRETPGAVFQRGTSVWMVFETASELELSAARVALADYARSMDVRVVDGAQVLRIDLLERYLAGFGIDATSIVLTIGDRVLDPSAPLDMNRSYRGDGALTLRVPFARASRIIQLEDNLVGDIIHVATGYGPARGLLKARRFAELDGLVSAHGVAIAPRVDDIEVVLSSDDVVISRPEGLRLSFSDVNGGTSLSNEDDGGYSGEFIQFSELHVANPHKFTSTVHKLELAVAEAPAHEVTDRRLDIIRFFLANRFAYEALAQLRVAAADDPQFEQTPGYQVLSGAAQILAHRESAASRHLSRPDLAGRADAAIWQTITHTHMQDWSKASEAALIGETVIGNFPYDLQATFFLAAARSATELNDYGSATRFLSQIEPGQIDPLLAAEYDYLRGRVADASGRPDIALRLWEAAGKSNNLSIGAEALLDKLKLKHREGRDPIEEILERVESLTFSWRGDETEIKTLQFLTQLYAEQGRYREAFHALEGAVLANPNSDTTRMMQEEMSAVFLSLFLDDAGKDLDPVKSLALFYDYRNMVPIGRKGDEVVRELASRLVDLDLLDQAADLLRHQVDKRLEGAASAQVATELALVHILNRKPEEALNALARTRVSRLPRALERQRRILEARALGDIGRNQQALDLLAGMNGPDAQRLRAENNWALRQWQEAGYEYEAIPGNRWKDNLELTATERQDVLRAAISFALAGDNLSTERIRSKYASLMSGGPEAAWFNTVAGKMDVSSVEFREVATQVASTDTFETFLQEYRRQYDPSLAAPPQQTPPPFGEAQPDPVGFEDAQQEAGAEEMAEGTGEGEASQLEQESSEAEGQPEIGSDRGSSAPQPTALNDTGQANAG